METARPSRFIHLHRLTLKKHNTSLSGINTPNITDVLVYVFINERRRKDTYDGIRF